MLLLRTRKRTKALSTGFGSEISPDTIRAAQEGRRDAQRVIFEVFQRPVLTLLRGLCREPELARDLAQDVFVQAFAKLNQLRETSAFGGWLKQLTLNTAFAYFRRPTNQNHSIEDEAESESDDWHSQADWLSRVDDIEALFSVLNDEERLIVWLFVVEDYTHQELAEQFAISATAVRQRYHRALQKLKDRSQS
ncbi:RNA polymerase subunit sigma-24 [Pseudidiomarina aestuarii]|uniref:RNA polymerase subunit sigma-24 n=1 Tax=Pseudidiomarina aestuarii TaxID=624146 RepID=A0A2T4D8D2_9GAMM|nr:RNA polymerase subunit sigma-24 [Pseudidiomarina aestuarii]PTB90018.1 RNA polymerase subunit sigma-24 [Pseudidiomarina aestuarii]